MEQQALGWMVVGSYRLEVISLTLRDGRLIVRAEAKIPIGQTWSIPAGPHDFALYGSDEELVTVLRANYPSDSTATSKDTEVSFSVVQPIGISTGYWPAVSMKPHR